MLFTVHFFLIIPYMLTAQEDDLRKGQKYREVERLIEIYDFNGAINILVDIVRDDPEEMEHAQRLIQDIRQKRDEFNAKYEELIRVLFEENDYEQGLQIISELEDMDQNPNTATSESLTSARISAELIYFRLLFNEIMDRAIVQINAGNYNNAVDIYRTGFELHKRTYNERNYGDIIKGPVDSNLGILLSSLTNFTVNYNILSKYSPADLTSSVERNEVITPELMADISTFQQLRNSVWKAAYVFEHQNTLLGEINEEVREDFFLSFANRLILGRLETRYDEGLIKAFDEYWNSAFIPLQEGVEAKLEETLARGTRQFEASQWAEANSSFSEASYWAGVAVQMTDSWSSLVNLDDSMSLYPGAQRVMRREYPHLENSKIRGRIADMMADLSIYRSYLDQYGQYDSEDLEQMNERRALLANETSTLELMSEDWSGFISRYNRDILYTDSFASSQNSILSGRFRSGINDYRNLNGTIALDSADLEILPLETEYAMMSGSLDRSLALIQGIPPEDAEEGDLTVLLVYPEQSYAIIETLKERNQALNSRVSDFKTRYQAIRNEIPQKEAMARYIGRAEALLLNLEDQLRDYDREQRRADQNMANAERYLNEGEFRFTRSRQAMNARNFPEAVQQLTTAQELFVQALSYNEEIANRADLDRRIADLQAEILAEENREVIRYVRENVNSGKSLYLQGLYAQSEIVLLRAENRWYTTNTDPNNEINYWLNLVRAALSVESGRTIEETEPLYVEMTQFLNLAYTNFEAGNSLIQRGNRQEGMALLDKADQNLNEILIPMPLNQQASVLKLRIQQLRDPDLFRVTFEEKFNSAVSRMRSEPDISYIDLKDLSAIQPDYPGMQRALYNVEIILGIRIPPPDPRALAESQDLYERAFAIVEGNIRSQFPVALTQLDRAIELNPENSTAIELKDRIQLDAGGQTAIVLSSSDNARFKAAEEKYINGEYFEAYAIVQQLLQDEKTASYPPLQDLKRRIESNF